MDSKKKFLIGVEGSDTITVRAYDIEGAAKLACKKLNGLNIIFKRVTGSNGLSGLFQGYRRERDGSLNSTGPQFHVMKAL